MFLFLGLTVASYFLSNYLSDLKREVIVLQNEELFSHEIEPIDYYVHEAEDSNGFSQTDAGYIYSKEDQALVDKMEELLEPSENIKTVGIFIMFILGVFTLHYYGEYTRLKKKKPNEQL